MDDVERGGAAGAETSEIGASAVLIAQQAMGPRNLGECFLQVSETARTNAGAEIGFEGCDLLFPTTVETSAVKPGTLLTDDEIFGTPAFPAPSPEPTDRWWEAAPLAETGSSTNLDEWWSADPVAPQAAPPAPPAR